MRGPRRSTVVTTVLLTLVSAALGVSVATAIFVWAGWYDVGAIVQHWQAVFSVIDTAVQRSVRREARGIVAPPFTAPLVRRGALIYAQHCLQCHGAPGIAPDDIGLAMQPQPGSLVHMMRRWKPAEVYWIVSNGIKMSGMPAWRYRLGDDDLWAVTALIARLPQLSPADYAALAAAAAGAPAVPLPPAQDGSGTDYRQTPVSAERGQVAMSQYACQSCHAIPGIVGGQVGVGPALGDYAQHRYIAGHLPNTQENLIRWLRSPQQVKPHTAMPDLNVNERDAADIAAYLLSPPK
jgi:mono/diheme cytochrome c family protein